MAVRIEDDGALRRVVLDRAGKANALTAEMLAAVRDAARCDARVLVLTGTGGVFSAGADLEAAKAGLAVSGLWKEVSDAVAGFAGLSIAALNGSCAGGAMGMMLACDLRLAVPGARFFYPVMKLGYLPQADDVPRLVALVGPARTKLILMGAAKIGAGEALAMGLVDRVAEDLGAAVAGVSEAVLAATDGHPAAIKRMV